MRQIPQWNNLLLLAIYRIVYYVLSSSHTFMWTLLWKGVCSHFLRNGRAVWYSLTGAIFLRCWGSWRMLHPLTRWAGSFGLLKSLTGSSTGFDAVKKALQATRAGQRLVGWSLSHLPGLKHMYMHIPMSLWGLLLELCVRGVSAATLHHCWGQGPWGWALNASQGFEELRFPICSLVGWLIRWLVVAALPRGDPTLEVQPGPGSLHLLTSVHFQPLLLPLWLSVLLSSFSAPGNKVQKLHLSTMASFHPSLSLQRVQQEGCSYQQEVDSWSLCLVLP